MFNMNATQFQGELARLTAHALKTETKPGEVMTILETVKLDLYMHMRAQPVLVQREQVVPIHRIVPKPGS